MLEIQNGKNQNAEKIDTVDLDVRAKVVYRKIEQGNKDRKSVPLL